MSDPVISAQHVCRRFGKIQAVDDVSLEVQSGSIFGLLGTNGAGKTTLIRMLMGHLYPDSGELQVFDSHPRQHDAATLQKVAFVSDHMQLPARMCLRDVMKLNRQFFPNWNEEFAFDMARQFDIDITAKISRMSLGQRRGAVLLQAICQGAELLVLDEPLSGLDAINRRKCLDILLAASVEHGQTLLVSSHLLHDVERIVDTIAVMNRGRMVLTGNLEQLKTGLRRIRIDGELPPEGLDAPRIGLRVLKQEVENHLTDLIVDRFDEVSQQALNGMFGSRVCIEHLNLEDIFVELSDQPSLSEKGTGV